MPCCALFLRAKRCCFPQAPVSDREFAVSAEPSKVQRMLNLARDMIGGGMADELMPRDAAMFGQASSCSRRLAAPVEAAIVSYFTG